MYFVYIHSLIYVMSPLNRLIKSRGIKFLSIYFWTSSVNAGVTVSLSGRGSGGGVYITSSHSCFKYTGQLLTAFEVRFWIYWLWRYLSDHLYDTAGFPEWGTSQYREGFEVDAITRGCFSATWKKHSLLRNDVIELWVKTDFYNIRQPCFFGVWEKVCNIFLNFGSMFSLYEINTFIYVLLTSLKPFFNIWVNYWTYDRYY